MHFVLVLFILPAQGNISIDSTTTSTAGMFLCIYIYIFRVSLSMPLISLVSQRDDWEEAHKEKEEEGERGDLLRVTGSSNSSGNSHRDWQLSLSSRLLLLLSRRLCCLLFPPFFLSIIIIIYIHFKKLTSDLNISLGEQVAVVFFPFA